MKGDELAEQRYNSRAWSGSVEGGWTFNAWSTNDYRFYVQPQVQVIYTRYHGNDVIENNGTVIENSHEDGISTVWARVSSGTVPVPAAAGSLMRS